MDFITEPERNVQVTGKFDVAVIGGGPGGFPAAVAAARHGARTVLIERYGFLGGMATNGLIGPILGHTAHKSHQPIIGGIPKELCQRMHKLGGAPKWEDALKQWGISFDVECMKYVLDRMVQQAGVSVLFHSMFVDAVVEDSAIKAVIVESKSGRTAVAAKVFVDATGDADVAFRSGAVTHKGRPADGKSQSMGTIFRLGGVKTTTPDERKKAAIAIRKAIDAGDLRMYNSGTGGRSSTVRMDEVTPNTTRFAGDATNVEDLTRGEFTVRADTMKIAQFFRQNVPGFQDSYLVATPPQIGIRQSRQAIGDYFLGASDVLNGNRFDDAVALGSWWIDIHCPLGRVKHNTHLCASDCSTEVECHMLTKHRDQLLDNLYPPEGGWYDIPYRCLTARKMGNLLVSGRCISASHEAMAGARVMGTCMSIGQAAGTAAAQSVANALKVRELDTKTLRRTLISDGVPLDLSF